MGDLVVERIHVEDFMSYREPQEIVLNGRGPVAVVGDNGAGKSTLVSKALSWGLYGVCAPERMGSGVRKRKGKGVIRRRLDPIQMATPKATETTVTIVLREDSQRKRWTVKRRRKLAGGDVIEVIEDGAKLGNDQGTIDRLIGVNHEVFVRTCLRGQNDPWNFAEATDGKKREILDSISGALALLGPFERAKKLKAQMAIEESGALLLMEETERRLGRIDLPTVRGQRDTWAATNQRRVSAIETEIDTFTIDLRKAEAEDKRMFRKVAERQAMPDRPALDLLPYNDAMVIARQALEKVRIELHVAQQDVGRAQALVKAGSCFECGQPLKGHRAHTDAVRDLAPLESAVSVAEGGLRSARLALEGAQAWLRDAVDAWRVKRDALPASYKERAPLIARGLRQADTRLEEAIAAENPYEAMVVQVEEELRRLRREVAHRREWSGMHARDRVLADAWIRTLGPTGVRAHLAEGTLTAIEAEANKWLNVLSDGKFSVTFSATKEVKRTKAVKEEIQTTILRGTEKMDLLELSGGEKRRINMAVDLGVAAAFSRGALALSLLVLDEEVFSGLDASGQQGVVTALHHAGVRDIVVIDHDPRFANVLPRTMMASLGPDGYSRMVEIA